MSSSSSLCSLIPILNPLETCAIERKQLNVHLVFEVERARPNANDNVYIDGCFYDGPRLRWLDDDVTCRYVVPRVGDLIERIVLKGDGVVDVPFVFFFGGIDPEQQRDVKDINFVAETADFGLQFISYGLSFVDVCIDYVLLTNSDERHALCLSGRRLDENRRFDLAKCEKEKSVHEESVVLSAQTKICLKKWADLIEHVEVKTKTSNENVPFLIKRGFHFEPLSLQELKRYNCLSFEGSVKDLRLEFDAAHYGQEVTIRVEGVYLLNFQDKIYLMEGPTFLPQPNQPNAKPTLLNPTPSNPTPSNPTPNNPTPSQPGGGSE